MSRRHPDLPNDGQCIILYVTVDAPSSLLSLVSLVVSKARRERHPPSAPTSITSFLDPEIRIEVNERNVERVSIRFINLSEVCTSSSSSCSSSSSLSLPTVVITIRYKSIVPPARRQTISCTPDVENSPIVEVTIAPACLRRTSSNFIDAAEVTDDMMMNYYDDAVIIVCNKQ